jgi:hypothetical protein
MRQIIRNPAGAGVLVARRQMAQSDGIGTRNSPRITLSHKGEIMTERSTPDSHQIDSNIAKRGVSRRAFVAGATTVGAMTMAQSAARAEEREDDRRGRRTGRGSQLRSRW